MKSIRLSLAINGVTQIVSLILTMGTMIVVSRLLTPAEIGIFSVSVSIIAFGHVFRDFGVGQYLVQAKELTRERLQLAFTVMLSISWLIAVILYLLRYPISIFYENAGMAEVMSVLALNFLILPFGAPLLSVFRREMKFGQIAVVTLGGQVVQAGVTISLAMLGASFMSMAWGAVAGNLVTVAALMLSRPKDAFLRPRLKGMSEILRFGAKSSSASLIGEVGNGAPDLILGRTLGFADVAIFSRAGGLTAMVSNQIVNIVRGVYFPAFAQGLRDGANPEWIYITTAARLTGLIAPILAVLGLLSEPLITFLFGDQWVRAAPLATVVCAYTLLASPFMLTDVTLVACGRVGLLMRLQIKNQTMRVIAISTSLYWDLEGVVIALAVSQMFQIWMMSRALREAIDLSVNDLWREVRTSFLLVPGSILGPVSVLFADSYWNLDLSDFWILAIAGLLALIGWVISLFALHHPLRTEVVNVLNKIRSSKP